MTEHQPRGRSAYDPSDGYEPGRPDTGGVLSGSGVMEQSQDETVSAIVEKSMMAVARQLTEERWRQFDQWGGPTHDDGHTISTWMFILIKHVGKLSTVALDWDAGADGDETRRHFIHRLVAIAAVCLSAAESMERARWSK